MHYVKACFKLVMAHIKTEIFALLLGTLIFFAILGSQTGWYIMSTAMTIGYAIMIYSASYKVADKDIKVYSEHKPYVLKGVVLALPIVLITFVLTLLYDFTFYYNFADYRMQMGAEFIIRNLFKVWNFTFEGFRKSADGSISLFYMLLSYALAPIASFFGYYAGTKRYDISGKFFGFLVYKKSTEDKE